MTTTFQNFDFVSKNQTRLVVDPFKIQRARYSANIVSREKLFFDPAGFYFDGRKAVTKVLVKRQKKNQRLKKEEHNNHM
jgi:hypothetical protein